MLLLVILLVLPLPVLLLSPADARALSLSGEVQFYSTALGIQAFDNKFERTGGLTAWARQGTRYGGGNGKPCVNKTECMTCWGMNFRNQFIDNELVEGNHVWNYDTKPTPIQNPAEVDYFPGGSKTIEPWFFGSLTNDQGAPVDPGNATYDPELALNRFIVFRSNKVESNGGIVVRGTSANVLVENSVIKESDVAVHVNYTTTKGGVVLSNNKGPAGVPDNYNPYVKNEKKEL